MFSPGIFFHYDFFFIDVLSKIKSVFAVSKFFSIIPWGLLGGSGGLGGLGGGWHALVA